jgi:hypothetical protein
MSKKIMFNDKFDLTQAVLDGRKTMTRRIIKLDKLGEYNFDNALKQKWGRKSIEAYINNYARYKVGEVIAIAQSYESVYNEKGLETMDMLVSGLKNHKGWQNKLFVAAGYMIHHIRITDIKIERLQDISDEDCLKEGIYRLDSANGNGGIAYSFVGASDKKHIGLYNTPRDAFEVLIDKVSGKGVFQSNPYVFVYEFNLID